MSAFVPAAEGPLLTILVDLLPAPKTLAKAFDFLMSFFPVSFSLHCTIFCTDLAFAPPRVLMCDATAGHGKEAKKSKARKTRRKMQGLILQSSTGESM